MRSFNKLLGCLQMKQNSNIWCLLNDMNVKYTGCLILNLTQAHALQSKIYEGIFTNLFCFLLFLVKKVTSRHLFYFSRHRAQSQCELIIYLIKRLRLATEVMNARYYWILKYVALIAQPWLYFSLLNGSLCKVILHIKTFYVGIRYKITLNYWDKMGNKDKILKPGRPLDRTR